MAEAQKNPPAAPAAKVEGAKPAASAKAKYTVVSGKHQNKDGSFTRQGEVVEMDPKVAKAFPNKFAPVMVAAVADAADEATSGE